MFEMGAQHSGIFVIVTIGSSVIVAFSYHNVASWTEQKYASFPISHQTRMTIVPEQAPCRCRRDQEKEG